MNGSLLVGGCRFKSIWARTRVFRSHLRPALECARCLEELVNHLHVIRQTGMCSSGSWTEAARTHSHIRPEAGGRLQLTSEAASHPESTAAPSIHPDYDSLSCRFWKNSFNSISLFRNMLCCGWNQNRSRQTVRPGDKTTDINREETTFSSHLSGRKTNIGLVQKICCLLSPQTSFVALWAFLGMSSSGLRYIFLHLRTYKSQINPKTNVSAKFCSHLITKS